MEKFKNFKKVLLITFAFSLILSLNAFAQENIKLSIPFSKVAPLRTTTLQGSSNYVKTKIPLPERWHLKKAVLNFSYINSTALLQGRSRLVVWLNNHPIAQITLNPQLPQGKVSVNLPVNLMKAGYNELNFTVSQHHTLECEDPASPELWTTIEFDNANFEFEYTLKRIPEDLSTVANFLFDSKILGESSVNIVIPDNKEDTVQLASVVASSIAMRFEYRPVKFTISDSVKKGVDNIVLGNEEFIRKTTGESISEKGSFVKIKTVPDDPTHALFILKGDNLDELKNAVYAFSSINFPFPRAHAVKVDEVKFSPKETKWGKSILIPGYEYSFKEIGFFTTNFRGIGAKAESLGFRIPSDAFLKPNSFLSIKLNFSYGSGMRKDSTLNIQVNGKYVASIHLDNIRGGYIRNYIIDLPLSLFKPGYNEITFTAVLTPLITGYCEFVQSENLQLTLFEDSKISLPSTPYWVEMPNLSLLFTDAFPFSKPSDFRNTGILMTEDSLENIQSAVNFVALLSQRAGYLPLGITISKSLEKLKDKNIIVLGTLSKVPEDILKASGLKIQSGGTFTYNIIKHFEKGETNFNAKLRYIISGIFPIFRSKSEGHYSKSQIKFSGKETEGWFALSQFESPHQSRKTFLLVTSPERESLEKGIKHLWDPAIYAKVSGSLTLFNTNSPEDSIASYSSGEYYYIGKMGLFSSLNAWIYAHPILFTIIMLLMVLILAYILYGMVKRFRRKRLNEAQS